MKPSGQLRDGPLVAAGRGTLLLAIVLALVVADRILGAPRRRRGVAGAVHDRLGRAVAGRRRAGHSLWRASQIGSVRLRLALASGVGLLVTVVNVLTTSALMFLNAHDLTLLLLLLAFAAVISLAFAYAVSGVADRPARRCCRAPRSGWPRAT